MSKCARDPNKILRLKGSHQKAKDLFLEFSQGPRRTAATHSRTFARGFPLWRVVSWQVGCLVLACQGLAKFAENAKSTNQRFAGPGDYGGGASKGGISSM